MRHVLTNGVKLAVYEAGSGPAVVLLHGWPELAYSWRHQLAPLVEAGFRVIAVDQRGYGNSDQPEDVNAYDLGNLTLDIIGVLDELAIEQAIVCGHDWGGLVAWHLPLLYPKRIAGVVGVCTPFFPRLPFEPVEMFRFIFGEEMYVVKIQQPGVVDDLLIQHVDRMFDAILRRLLRTSKKDEEPRFPL
jgi:pimeloyl-ACP methyl ester carboxylesterase